MDPCYRLSYVPHPQIRIPHPPVPQNITETINVVMVGCSHGDQGMVTEGQLPHASWPLWWQCSHLLSPGGAGVREGSLGLVDQPRRVPGPHSVPHKGTSACSEAPGGA